MNPARSYDPRAPRSLRRVLLLAVIAALAIHCGTTDPPARPRVDPLGSPLPRGDSRPSRFLEALLATGAERRALRGVADLGLDGPEGSARAKQIVFLERPARLRVEVLGFLNQSVAVLTTDGERFHLFRAEDRSVEEGEVRPTLLWEVAGIALQPDAAVRVLLGVPGVPDGALALPPRGTREGGVRVGFAHGGFVTILEFDSKGELSRWRLERDGAGEALVEATYSEYLPLAGTRFAHQIDLRDYLHGTRAQVQWKDVVLNPDLPREVFRIERAGGR